MGPDQIFPAKTYPGGKVADLLGALSTSLTRPPTNSGRDGADITGTTGLTACLGLSTSAILSLASSSLSRGAAGATGSIVGQICKLKGARVLGIAEVPTTTCKWLKDDLGFDDALNYKDPDFRKKFKEATKVRSHLPWRAIDANRVEANEPATAAGLHRRLLGQR